MLKLATTWEVPAPEGGDSPFAGRSVLNLLFDGGTPPDQSAQPIFSDQCPNCGTPCADSRSPYCSDCCREEAAFIRQTRQSMANGLLADPERQLALGQKLWRLLGGGMPHRISLITEKQLASTLKKRPQCEVCGAPSITVDNIGSG